jgi:mersacidin/lichenicidin family type 2 lantibiotic
VADVVIETSGYGFPRFLLHRQEDGRAKCRWQIPQSAIVSWEQWLHGQRVYVAGLVSDDTRVQLRLRKERRMSPINIIRAWKDAEYRQSLSAAELAMMPAHPAGVIALTDDDLESVAGGRPKLTEGVCHTVVACPTGTGCMTFVSDGCPGGVSVVLGHCP